MTRDYKKLNHDFYKSSDVVKIAVNLLGKVVVSNIDGNISSALITETEAYAGIADRASHAFGGRRTKRTEVMYREGGCAYVYLCYGMHSLFNIVTGVIDVPDAVLIRGGIVVEGHENVIARTGISELTFKTAEGPGRFSRAMGINCSMSGESLQGNQLWVEDHDYSVNEEMVIAGPRIGVDYAGDDALLPYRFLIKPKYLESLIPLPEK